MISDREKQCLELAAQGYSDREIGRRLDIGPSTVNEYIERVKRKLDVYTRIEAIVTAINVGFINVAGLILCLVQIDGVLDLLDSAAIVII